MNKALEDALKDVADATKKFKEMGINHESEAVTLAMQLWQSTQPNPALCSNAGSAPAAVFTVDTEDDVRKIVSSMDKGFKASIQKTRLLPDSPTKWEVCVSRE